MLLLITKSEPLVCKRGQCESTRADQNFELGASTTQTSQKIYVCLDTTAQIGSLLGVGCGITAARLIAFVQVLEHKQPLGTSSARGIFGHQRAITMVQPAGQPASSLASPRRVTPCHACVAIPLLHIFLHRRSGLHHFMSESFFVNCFLVQVQTEAICPRQHPDAARRHQAVRAWRPNLLHPAARQAH